MAILTSVGTGAAGSTGVPAALRTTAFATLYVLLLLSSRFLVVDAGNAPPVSLIAPSAGVAVVWLARARSRRQLTIDTVLLVVLSGLVLALTDGTAMQIALLVLAPIQYLPVAYLLRRWTPHLWGAGGRRAMRRLSDFGLTLLAMAVAVLVYSAIRTAAGELLIPEETFSLAVGRATRSLAAMATLGVVGFLAGGWLAEAHDAGRPAWTPPQRRDLGHLLGASLATVVVFLVGFGLNPRAPTTFILTLTVVWIAVRLGPLATAIGCLVIGSVGVALTITDVGPIAAIPDPANRSAVAQVFVVVLMVLGLVISLSRREVLDTVSSLERSEAANARRAEELDLVMANLIDAVAIIEKGGRVVHANNALVTAFGTQPAAALEKVRDDSEIPDDERLRRASDGVPLTDAVSPLTRALEGETVKAEEYRTPREDGPIRWVEISGIPLPAEPDHPERAMIVLRDVTSEKDHQLELAARASELDLMLSRLSNGVAIVEEGGRYIQSNDALRDIMIGHHDNDAFKGDAPPPTGYRLHHVDGRPLEFEDYPHVRAIHGEEVVAEEYYVRRPATTAQQVVEISAYPLTVEPGVKRRAMVVVRDITAEKAHQDSLVGFAGTVAHDLNNPLSVIDGWAEAIQEDLSELDDPVAAGAASMVQHIRGSVDQMRVFVSDLLAHAVARDQSLRCETVHLGNMVKHIASTRDRPGERGGNIEAGELLDVWVDRLLVRQVFDNLIGNAMKYVAPGTDPRVRVSSTKVSEGWARVVVSDNGIGIAPAERALIFDSFHRVTSQGYSGTGLGLAICKRIVERHGGEISVEDNPDGIGSAFVLTLPTTPEAYAAATSA